MDRHSRIISITFAGSPLPLPMSVRVSRRAEPRPAGGDDDAFVTSVQLGPVMIVAEVRIRGTASAEGLHLGQKGDLCFTVAATADDQPARNATIAGAVLTGIEHSYEQTAMATATLRFAAEAAGGTADPFHAEEAP
jgi:hypothetical protein